MVSRFTLILPDGAVEAWENVEIAWDTFEARLERRLPSPPRQ
jgi:hypothetical protein